MPIKNKHPHEAPLTMASQTPASTLPASSKSASSASPATPPSSHGPSTHHAKPAKLVPFLRKVQLLCETAPPHIARWSADGKQFDVLDPKGFDELLKVHFEGAAPATFHRQLFFYGWVKLNHSNGGGDERTKGTWSFRHPCFLRDEPSKIYEIKRYARASDREEQEDGSRVDILERRVSALQSLVDDLSRKLAAVQLCLEKAPLAAVPEQPKQQLPLEKPGRKRVKDSDDELFADDLRLTEDELMTLFEEPELAPSPLFMEEEPSEVVPRPSVEVSSAQQASAPSLATLEEQKAHTFLTSLMSTPQFHAAITASKTLKESAPKTKVESLPQMSVF